MKGVNSFDENGYWSRYSNDNWSVCKIFDDVLGYEYALSGERFDALEIVDKLASLEAENASLIGAAKADDERLRINGERVGIQFGCDTPEAMADEIIRLRAENADAQARLAGYEEGYDPKVKTPQHDEWILVKHVNDDLTDPPMEAKYVSGDFDDEGVQYHPYGEDGWVYWTDILRWFPLPGAKEPK